MNEAHKLLKAHNLDKSAWGIRIVESEGNTFFSLVDRFESDDWITCACGEQDPRLHRKRDTNIGIKDSPLDNKLYKYGMDFTDAVHADNFLEAAQILVKIEERAAQLLSKMK